MVGFDENNFWDIHDQYTDKLFLEKNGRISRVTQIVCGGFSFMRGSRGGQGVRTPPPPPEKSQK